MQLRQYQQDAVQAVYNHLSARDDNPCVVIPTGGGKTPVIATICRDAVRQWNGRVLILAHIKELLEQSADKLRAICPDVRFGIHSASLRKRDTRSSVIVAGIQSVYRKACDLGPFDLVLIDEAHMIPPEGEGMYQTYLTDALVVNPRLRCVGFTATPYRMRHGSICSRDHFLNRICYEIGVRELINQGYLSNLVSQAGVARADLRDVHVRAGEFQANELEAAMNEDALVKAACTEIVHATRDRKAVLIFAAGVKHGRHVQHVLQSLHHVECGFVCGETPADQRDATLKRFRGVAGSLFDAQPLKYLCNVNVLTTGFDAPNVDCVVLLRPTLSPGLYYQMVGRGFRLFPGKANCLVLDFAGNVMRHGPVDAIDPVQREAGEGSAPVKECPDCHAIVPAAILCCPRCGHDFPEPEKQVHEERPTRLGILTGQINDTQYDVLDVDYQVHVKRRDPSAPQTLRVDYKLGFAQWQSEWVCFEHDGFARAKAEAWWRRRSPDPVPGTAEEALTLAEAGALRQTLRITVREIAGDRFPRIVAYEFGPMPDSVESEHEEAAV